MDDHVFFDGTNPFFAVAAVRRQAIDGDAYVVSTSLGGGDGHASGFGDDGGIGGVAAHDAG